MSVDTALLKTAETFYDTHVAGKLQGFVEGNPRVECALTTLREQARPNPRRVLEIGCAIGDICWRMSSLWPAAEIVGIDLSSKSIELATRLFGGPNVRFVHGTLTSVELAGGFDLIVMFDVYEHIAKTDRRKFHAALDRLLSDDGQMVLSFPTPEHLAWLRQHVPGEIQPVDEDVNAAVILALAGESGTALALYKTVDVWHKGDYAHAVMSRRTWDATEVAAPPSRLTQRLQRLFLNGARTTRSERLKRLHRRLGTTYYPQS
jgi:SAM-dependent methyltransferase